MIENRFRLEREIFRGRLAIRQQSAFPRDDSPVTDTNPAHHRLEGGLGAPASQSVAAVANNAAATTSSRPPLDAGKSTRSRRGSRSAQLAIESQAEEDFESRSPSIFRSKPSRGGSSSLRSTQSYHGSRRATPAPTNGNNSPTHTVHKRRASTATLGSNAQYRADLYNGTNAPSSSSPSHSRKHSSATVRPQTTASSSSSTSANTSKSAAALIARLREQSLGRFSRFRHRDQDNTSSDDDLNDLEFARDRKKEKAAEGAAESSADFRVDPNALDATWSSSEDSLDDPVYDMEDNTPFDATIDSHDDNVLGLQIQQDKPEQDR